MARSAKFYVWLVFTAGILTALVTLARAEWRTEHLFELIAYVSMGSFASRLKVTLPGVRGTLSLSFIFILVGVMELHTADVMIISCVATLAQSLLAAKVRPKPVQLAFNFGTAAVCGVLCDVVYHSSLLRRVESSLPVMLLFASVSFFVVNTLMVSHIIALTEGIKTRTAWLDNFYWTGPQYVIGAALAGVIHVCNTRFGWQYAVLAFPGIYLLDRSYRVYLRRLQEEKQHVTDHEESYAKLADAQQRLMALSRQAGMAEVATGVLHNVGNVLNSVNVSATLVADGIRKLPIDNLVSLARLMEEHAADLPDFLSNDPKGQRVIPYLAKLAVWFGKERENSLRELQLLTGHIDHIKQIVATQQNYGKVCGLIEKVSLPSLVEDAIQIVQAGLDRRGIRLEREYEEVPVVALDKHSVLQILLNLLRNAEEAIEEAGNSGQLIRVRIRRHGDERVRLEVSDSGVGLTSENLMRIFQHGFTTKTGGHGFGLHSGALTAKQLGGALRAESDGAGLGATFTLELPLDASALGASIGPHLDVRSANEPPAASSARERATTPACEITVRKGHRFWGRNRQTALRSTPSVGV